jgi:hypothetical protein
MRDLCLSQPENTALLEHLSRRDVDVAILNIEPFTYKHLELLQTDLLILKGEKKHVNCNIIHGLRINK